MDERYKDPLKVIEKLDLPKSEKISVFQKVHCPSCHSEVSADNINLDKEVAKCSTCNSVFSIAEILKEVKAFNHTKEDVFKPKGIEINQFRDELEFSIDANSFSVIEFSIWMILMLACMMAFIGLSTGKFGSWMWITISGVLFTISSISLARYTRNKFRVILGAKKLSVINPSTYLIRDQSIDISRIDQIFVKKNVMNANGTLGYSVNAVVHSDHGQVEQKLVGVKTITQAQFLEQEIESHLGIVDRRIPQETS